MDITHGINPYQSVDGMVKDYEKKIAKEQADLADDREVDPTIPREHMDVDREGERLVARGRINPETGATIPLTPKARKVLSFVPSAKFMANHQAIKWAVDGDESWRAKAV